MSPSAHKEFCHEELYERYAYIRIFSRDKKSVTLSATFDNAELLLSSLVVFLVTVFNGVFKSTIIFLAGGHLESLQARLSILRKNYWLLLFLTKVHIHIVLYCTNYEILQGI